MASVMLYFGSFNPIHNGHIAIAEYVLAAGLADELWFVVSPQNPLKPAGILADENDRLEMVRLAVAGSPFAPRMKACDVEFSMPRPSYTTDTLKVLERMFPDNVFSVLTGSDILPQFTRWKEWDRLAADYDFYVYPRSGHSVVNLPPELAGRRFTILNGAPLLDVSSTNVRNAAGAEMECMLSPAVYEYIKNHKLWKTE